jgi:hypothetical protein
VALDGTHQAGLHDGQHRHGGYYHISVLRHGAWWLHSQPVPAWLGWLR